MGVSNFGFVVLLVFISNYLVNVYFKITYSVPWNTILNFHKQIFAAFVSENDPSFSRKPYIDGSKIFHGGVIYDYDGKSEDVTSPILNEQNGNRVVIGRLAQLSSKDVNDVRIIRKSR